MASADSDVRPLRLWFKGERTYLHGTDLFNLLVEVTDIGGDAGAADIRLSFYYPISRGVEAVRLPSGVRPAFRPAALLEFARAGQRIVWAVRERPDEIVVERRPYDERLVADGAVIESVSILQATPTPYSFIERVVALNKRLLEHADANPKRGWWFSRLELVALPPQAKALRLRRLTDLGGRLVKSSIECDETLVGHVFFSEKAG